MILSFCFPENPANQFRQPTGKNNIWVLSKKKYFIYYTISIYHNINVPGDTYMYHLLVQTNTKMADKQFDRQMHIQMIGKWSLYPPVYANDTKNV